MEKKLKPLRDNYFERIKAASFLKELDGIFLDLFGKNGQLTLLPKDLPKLPEIKRRVVGPLFNQIKQELEDAIENRRQEIREISYKKLSEEKLTLEPDILHERQGYLHPLTRFEQETIDLFKKIGFMQFQAPHIDTDEYNFELLNIPKGHPSRDLWDTLYLESELLLRTHTSNGQIRAMRQLKLPIRVMIMDRCFRYENLDARHEHTFEQFELIYIDKGVSMANLQYLSEYFFKAILGKDMKARLRPKYFPFVEPGAGVDGLCIFCKGKARLPDGQGCKVCGGVGWLELAGAGIIHPQVLRNGGIDPNIYSGIAWGFGPMRMAMIKYGIDDIRKFLNGDLKIYENK